MQFSVPQFIEHEPKIVGPLTFKQLIFIGGGIAICIFLYFSIAKINFSLFLILAIVILGFSVALALLKVGGQSLPAVLGNFFRFSLTPKIYIWKKKETSSVFLKNTRKTS